MAWPVRSSWPRRSGWPTTSAGPRSGSSTSAGGPTAVRRRSTRAGTSRAPRSSTGGPTWSRTASSGETILLVGPDRMAALAARVGIADGTTVVVYDDSQGLFAARAWWSFLAYGLESVRVLDGGFPAWVGEGREVSNAQPGPGGPAFTVRGPNRMRLTTPDVRGPARVTRRHAARRAGTGRVPRLSRATPSGSATSRARSTSRSGRPASPAASGCVTAPSCATSSTARTSCAAAGWSATTARGSPRPSSRSC